MSNRPRTPAGRLGRRLLGDRCYARIAQAVAKSILQFHHLRLRARRLHLPLRLARHRIVLGWRMRTVREETRHVSGPIAPALEAGAVIAVCPVRDGRAYVRSFLQHHLRLGVDHFIVLDNGSVDGTQELFAASDRVTLFQSRLPFRVYQAMFREFLVERAAASGSWVLVLDIDELFDFPQSSRIGLKGLVGYLEALGFSGMIAHMLEMFPDTTLQDIPDNDSNLLETHCWYDLSGIRRQPFSPRNPEYGCYRWTANSEIAILRGGIQRNLFGTPTLLTKTPLFRPSAGARLGMVQHFLSRGEVADISGVLYHFKFTSSFRRRLREDVEQRRHGDLTHYRAMARGLDRIEAAPLRQESSKKFNGPEPLVSQEFLVTTRQWEEWVRDFGKEAGE